MRWGNGRQNRAQSTKTECLRRDTPSRFVFLDLDSIVSQEKLSIEFYQNNMKIDAYNTKPSERAAKGVVDKADD